VPPMHTIEIADGDDTAAQICRKFRESRKPLNTHQVTKPASA
jgi:hypothetical protein